MFGILQSASYLSVLIMTELLEELEQKRAISNNEAERHRRVRDDLNQGTKDWVRKRDELNAQVRQLVEEAAKHREKRDELNQNVRESKGMRDEWNQKVSELNDKVNDLKRENAKDKGPPVSRLKRDLKNLEFKFETSVLTTEKEREMIDIISKLQAQISEREEQLEKNTDIKDAITDLRASRDEAEAHHLKVSEFAEFAQNEHDAMIALYEKADAFRKEADAAQEKFIETKLAADEEHRKHIEAIRQVHDYDKITAGLRQKERKARKKKQESAVKKEAEDIFDRFKAGEKLSTEDIMALQKSGYL